jgi:hypothetical protein
MYKLHAVEISEVALGGVLLDRDQHMDIKLKGVECHGIGERLSIHDWKSYETRYYGIWAVLT